MIFAKGDRVQWESHSHGIRCTKQGHVIEVVAPNTMPTQISSRGSTRPETSYVVLAHVEGERRLRRYWPFSNRLDLIEARSAPMQPDGIAVLITEALARSDEADTALMQLLKAAARLATAINQAPDRVQAMLRLEFRKLRGSSDEGS